MRERLSGTTVPFNACDGECEISMGDPARLSSVEFFHARDPMNVAHIAIGVACAAIAAFAADLCAGEMVTDESTKLDDIRAAATKVKPLHTKLGKPQPGD